MPIVDESKQNKGVNNNTRNKQMAIDMEYYNRLNHLRFKSPYLGAKYQQRVIPVRTLNGVQDVFVDNRGTIKQGGHTHSKLYNYSNKNRTHPIKGAYAREVDSWNNNTSPIKALVNSGIGYALAPAAQAVYDYTKGALDISKNPTKASNYLVMLPAIGYAVKAPLKRGVEVAMRTSNNANPIEDIVYNMHKASPKKHAGVLSYISTGVGYNTYAPEAYTGFQKAAKGNDMIDAYLYNKTINPYSAPMRWGKYVKYNKPGTPTKQTVEYVPQRSNYVYHTTPKYDYKKAFYKYPQYRKWDSKLQESLKHEWTTDFSGIPGRKIDTIQYHWNKNAVPIGAITGGIGGTIDMYNNMNTFDMANPYYFRQLNQEWGN